MNTREYDLMGWSYRMNRPALPRYQSSRKKCSFLLIFVGWTNRR